MNKIHEMRQISKRLERLFSDWLQVPAYVVGISETGLNPCRGSRHGFVGLSSPFLHRLVKDDIRGRWQGSGPAVIVDDVELCDFSPHFGDIADRLAGVVCHEFSHNLDSPILFAPDDYLPEDPDGRSKSFFVRSVEQPDKFYASDYAPSVRDGHGASWLRLVCHVGHRMQDAGYQIWWPMAVDHHFYQISPAVQYYRDLGDEPKHLAQVPLRELKNHPIPPKFLARWQENLTDWPDA